MVTLAPATCSMPRTGMTLGADELDDRLPVVRFEDNKVRENDAMSETLVYEWRGPLTDGEMVELVKSCGTSPTPGWWDRVRPRSLGSVSARTNDGLLVGFANVAWDGGDHAFLVDPRTRGSHQHRGIGREVVRRAVLHAKAAGCEWLHVDFEPDLAPFYFDS